MFVQGTLAARPKPTPLTGTARQSKQTPSPALTHQNTQSPPLKVLSCVLPDIVLADYHLDNDVTGVMALTALNEMLDEPLPGIMITAGRTEAVAEEIKREGYTVLHKPLKPAPLRAMAARVLKSHKLK